MAKEKEKQLYLIKDRQFLRNLTLICITISASYSIFYLLMGMKRAGAFNIFILAFYGISLLSCRSRLTSFRRYLTLSIYIVQIFFFSFLFFPRNAGYHFYFLVVPLIIIFIKKHRFISFKFIYSTIPVLLFFYCEFFSSQLSPLYELSENMTRVLYMSTVLIIILGMAVIIYFFIWEKEKLIRELNDAKIYAESLFHFSPCAIYTVDTKGRVIDFNKKAEILTAYTQNELKNKKVDFIASHSLSDKGGKKKSIERYSSELYDENKNIIGRIISFIDITDRVELEDFKIGIERVIHHDLKTPLNTILGFPDLMLEDSTFSDENKLYLNLIKNAGQNMLNLINLSQDLYKIEKGTYQFNKKKCHVFSILEQISIDLEYLQKEKQSVMEFFYNGKPLSGTTEVLLHTEKTLLYMILTNLIKNAFEATPRKNNIKVDIKDGSVFSLSISNKGEIPHEIRDNFFEKYVTSGKKKGNGLGTYSAKLMSLAIGADLKLESSAEKGTILTFIMAV